MRKLVLGAACLTVLGNYVPVAFGKAPKADNTAQNLGALEKGAVTAEKQKNSKNEVSVLAAIRKSLMAQKELSMDAKNAKIVYSDNGLVILRGAVDSESEKVQVGDLAKSCDGVTAIKNELTIAKKAH
jgi:osmotically-inducible protein OsmY